MSKTTLTYKAAMEELQEIVGLLETNAISIDQLSEKVKRAAFLVEFCQNQLRGVQKEVETLFEQKNG